MNSASDTLLKNTEDQAASAREETLAEPSATLVDLGRVSETKGGWIGTKADSGAGLQAY
jgi:hypothetical protein